MSGESVGDAEVDVCAACGGVWVDWFDGEVREVAERVVRGGVSGRPSDPEAIRAEARAIGACPRCLRQLASERYVAKSVVTGNTGPTKTTTETGAVLLRCEECASAFVSRTALEVLASLPADEEPPMSEREDGTTRVLEPMPWERLLALVKGLFSRGDRR